VVTVSLELVTSAEQGKSSGMFATVFTKTGVFWGGISFFPDETVTPL
jgi:hypothetical protein